jgi:hypothetical protein
VIPGFRRAAAARRSPRRLTFAHALSHESRLRISFGVHCALRRSDSCRPILKRPEKYALLVSASMRTTAGLHVPVQLPGR